MSKRVAIIELVRALAVLALICLNFVHAPLASAGPYGGWTGIDAGDYCGDPLEDDDQAHAPCHACRIGGGADLPPACRILPPRLSEGALAYAAVASFVRDARYPGPVSARGPPAR